MHGIAEQNPFPDTAFPETFSDLSRDIDIFPALFGIEP
jgi:hypothetical protein